MITIRYATLKNKKVIPTTDSLEWAKTFAADRSVDHTMIGDIKVSTVFLGMDHGFAEAPLWFETMIFGGKHDGFQHRYETWNQAKKGHARAVLLAKGKIKKFRLEEMG